MHSSKFIVGSLVIAAVACGFTANVAMADPVATPTQPSETTKIVAEMKEEIRKLQVEVDNLKKELATRKARAEQKHAAKMQAKQQQEAIQQQNPKP